MGANLNLVKGLDPTTVRPNFVNNGGVLKGVAPPTPTIRSQANMVAAFYKRVAMAHPVHYPERLAWAEFVLTHYIPWLLEHVRERKVMTDDEYIDTLDIPESKKNRLKTICEQIRREGYILNQTLRVIQAFIKLEFYEEPTKFPRVIMPVDELARAAYGAPMSNVNHAIMDLPTSIKAIPFDERPALLRSVFGDDPVDSNDFSSFESSTDKWVITNILTPIFLAIAGNTEDGRVGKFMRYMRMNQKYKYGNLMFVSGPVMTSGSLITASGNFFVNDSAIAYAAWKNLGTGVNHPRMVEGDDSVFKKIPGIDRIFKNLGFSAKLEAHEHVRDASFCRVYVGGTAALTDGMYVLSKLGWSSAKYLFATKNKKLGLLKTKCMSYICQYSGGPIVGPICSAILTKLEKAEAAQVHDWWEREKIKFWKPELRDREVLFSDRMEYARLFKINPEEQLLIEEESINCIKNWDIEGEGECFIDSPTALEVIKFHRPQWHEYFQKYAFKVESDSYVKERFNFRREMKPWSDFQKEIIDKFNSG